MGQSITKGNPPITNFICPVLRVYDGNQVATGIFLASNYLLTVASILYDYDLNKNKHKLVNIDSLLVAIIYSQGDRETLQVVDHRIHNHFDPASSKKRHNIAFLMVR